MHTSTFNKLLSGAITLIMVVAALGSMMPWNHAQQAVPVEGDGNDAALTVEIASPEHFGRRLLVIDQGFPVIVSNVSNQPVRVWRDWCSWGYQQLSFEVTDDTGRTSTVRRKEHPFLKNYPDFWTLGAHEPLVLSVALIPDLWESDGVPLPDIKGKALTLRAVFAAAEDDQSRGNKVWSGRVQSTSRLYEFQ